MLGAQRVRRAALGVLERQVQEAFEVLRLT